ncbi:MAG: DUF4080 domain-containing protein, partial [Parasporobacterium sp.]|nr:DUF4080 domain-containing protein [Parasporobacterium sp.]
YADSVKAGGEVDVEIKEFTINQQREHILRDIYELRPDVTAFPCYIWNIEYVCAVAGELKKVRPDMKIWLGGPEVSYNAEEFMKAHCWADVIMRGEGEETFSELCRAKEAEYPFIKGLTYRAEGHAYPGPKGNAPKAGNVLETMEKPAQPDAFKTGQIISTMDRKLLDMDRIPFPYNDENLPENSRIIYYESSRGCPFSCSYCLSSEDKCLRYRSLEKVFDELQFFIDREVPQVKFVDRTFNVNRDRTRGIWEYLIAHDKGITNFHFEISADLLDEEELAIISRMRPGLIQLEIGVQSTNPETLRAIGRNMNLNKLKANVAAVKSFGNVHQHLDLIAGLPFEDIESFRKSFNDVYAMGPAQLQLGFLKVLKGTRMEKEFASYGGVCTEAPPYEVLKTDMLKFEDVLRLKKIEEMVELYANSGQYSRTLPLLMSRWEATAFDFFDRLGDYFSDHGLFSMAHSRLNKYSFILKFAEENMDIDRAALKEAAMADYAERDAIRGSAKVFFNSLFVEL